MNLSQKIRLLKDALEQQILEMRCNGATYRAIQQALGVSTAQAHRKVKADARCAKLRRL